MCMCPTGLHATAYQQDVHNVHRTPARYLNISRMTQCSLDQKSSFPNAMRVDMRMDGGTYKHNPIMLFVWDL